MNGSILKSWMQFEGDQFIPWVNSRGDENLGWALLLAWWHYWSKTGCEGLPTDDAQLYRICGKPERWNDIRAIIFGEFFVEVEGQWHHGITRDKFKKGLKKIAQTRQAARAKHNKERAAKGLPPLPEENEE